MAQDGRLMVIVDGGLEGLVAAACASEEAIGRGADAGPLLWWCAWAGDERVRAAAARRQAEHLGLQLVEREVSQPIQLPDAGAGDSAIARGLGSVATSMLLAAAWEAERTEIDRIVWPARAGEGEQVGQDAPAPDLGEAASIADRALLVARLASLDAPGLGVRIETPFADLSDQQLADLALDLGVPVGLCWWNEPGAEGGEAAAAGGEAAAAARSRWEGAIAALGVGESSP